MARPLRRVLIQLSIKLGVVVTELEDLPMRVIAEYLAELAPQSVSEDKPVEDQLMVVFGGPRVNAR